MNINLTGHHVDITEPLREYVNSKFDRLERHFDHVTDVHVVLGVEKLRHKAEATMHISGGTLFADAIEEDMYAAIDGLVDKLDRQVKKHKEKVTDHHRAEGSIKTQF
ncbi:MAG: ribosome hibernation promoting factor [Xanthomonadaceae bacterium]|jgi:putative sigma-54 modulation protein|nr:ribosome hibernation promoting factor [Xanthomonadaceae bacterium]